MNPLGVCSEISPHWAPALIMNSSFSKQRLLRPMGPPHPTCLGVQGGKENRTKGQNMLFSGSPRRLDCPFLPFFFQRHVSISVLSEQSCAWPLCRGTCTVAHTMSSPAPPRAAISPVSRAAGLCSALSFTSGPCTCQSWQCGW